MTHITVYYDGCRLKTIQAMGDWEIRDNTLICRSGWNADRHDLTGARRIEFSEGKP